MHGFAFVDQAIRTEVKKFNSANTSAVDLGDVDDGQTVSIAEEVIESETEGLNAGDASRPVFPQLRFAYDSG